jgi:hypothetical protein
MRLRIIAGLAASAAVVGGVLIATGTAQAAQAPCYTGGSGNTAHGGCYSSPLFHWRLVADCWDRSNIRMPIRVNTVYAAWTTGNGDESVACAEGLSADPRIEIS